MPTNQYTQYFLQFDSLPAAVMTALLLSSCLWVPLVFGAFALGRRKLGLWFYFALLTAESLSLGVLIWFGSGPW